MANHANRLAKLEQQTNEDAVRFVWMKEGETREEAWLRSVADSGWDAPAAATARESGRVYFMSWADARL